MYYRGKPITQISEYLDKYSQIRQKRRFNWLYKKKRWLPRYYEHIYFKQMDFYKSTCKYISNVQNTPTYYTLLKMVRPNTLNYKKYVWKKFGLYRKKNSLLGLFHYLDMLPGLRDKYMLLLQKTAYLDYMKMTKCLPRVDRKVSYFFTKLNNKSKHTKRKGRWVLRKYFGLYLKRRLDLLHFAYLSKLQRYTDCFYVVSKFVYWYSYHNKNYKRSVFRYSNRFSSFRRWYSYNFVASYKNALSVLYTYNYSGSYSSTKLLSQESFKTAYYRYLQRTQHLFSFNFWYRRCTRLHKYSLYDGRLVAKLNSVQRIRLTSSSNHSLNSYAFDASALFYSSDLKNPEYKEHMDEKHYRYTKEILLKKVNPRSTSTFIRDKVEDSSNIKGIIPIFKPLNNYSNIHFFLNITKSVSNTRVQSFFIDKRILKASLFLLCYDTFYFFRDYLCTTYKTFLYDKVLNMGRHFLHYEKPKDGWVNIWYLLIPSYVDPVSQKRQAVLEQILAGYESFFKASSEDLFGFIDANSQNRPVFASYKTAYAYLYSKFVPKAKQNMYLNYLSSILKGNKVRFYSILRKKLYSKNRQLITQLDEAKKKKLLSKYRYFCLRKLVNRRNKIKNVYGRTRFFKRRRSEGVGGVNIIEQLTSHCEQLADGGGTYKLYDLKYFQTFGASINTVNQLAESIKQAWSNYLNNHKLKYDIAKSSTLILYSLVRRYIKKSKKRLFFMSRKQDVSDMYRSFTLLNFLDSKETIYRSYPQGKLAPQSKESELARSNNVLNYKIKNISAISSISLFFILSKLKNKYMLLFFSLKTMLLSGILTEAVTYYKNKVMLYNLVKHTFLSGQLSWPLPRLNSVLNCNVSELL